MHSPITYHVKEGFSMAEVGRYDANLRLELCAYYEWGLSVRIDEKVYHTEDLTDVCHVLEESNYMRDYEQDDSGQIKSVNFTKIEK